MILILPQYLPALAQSRLLRRQLAAHGERQAHLVRIPTARTHVGLSSDPDISAHGGDLLAKRTPQ